MLIAPRPLSSLSFSREELEADRKAARPFDRCALGKRALYVGGLGLSGIYYIPLARIRRVYKRLAVSRGFYEGKVYGTLCYLVILYDDGREKVCRFTREEDLNDLLSAFRQNTGVPVGKP